MSIILGNGPSRDTVYEKLSYLNNSVMYTTNDNIIEGALSVCTDISMVLKLLKNDISVITNGELLMDIYNASEFYRDKLTPYMRKHQLLLVKNFINYPKFNMITAGGIALLDAMNRAVHTNDDEPIHVIGFDIVGHDLADMWTEQFNFILNHEYAWSDRHYGSNEIIFYNSGFKHRNVTSITI